MKVREIVQQLEQLAPRSLQEGYDNSGLLTGSMNQEISAALLTLDCTEAVVQEAIDKSCGLIVAHHPIIFGGLKSITGKNYVERTVIKAIQNDIAIYAIHTNLDHVLDGVNSEAADRLGLVNRRILSPKSDLLLKLHTFIPVQHVEEVRQAIFDAGAGVVGQYDQCSFNVDGTGTFRAGEGTDPHVGQKGELHKEPETRVEMVFPNYLQQKVIAALINAHPYEEVAYDLVPLTNNHPVVGAGIIGELPVPVEASQFLQTLKSTFDCGVIKYTDLIDRPIKKVAFCGGSGAFLRHAALSAGADIFVTGDFKYHEFFDAEGEMVIADIGHYESEQYTPQLLARYLKQNFATFAFHFSEVKTNPVNYLA